MPYDVLQGVEGCSGWAVVKTEDDEIMGCHSSKAEAEDQLTALNIAEYGENSLYGKKPRRPKKSEEPRAADSYPPTDGMVEEAQRGLDWRSEFGRGGTAIGIARARDIVNRKELPINTWRRVKAYFDRHEIDKKAEGFSPGEDGFPSNGRIAWALWGGDAGYSRAKAIMEDFNNDERSVMDEIRGIDGIYPVTPLQNHLYEVLEDTVDIFGQFEQGIGAQGAHYVGPEDNPFASEGMVCSNCAFYEGPRACEIVSGDIDPGGICKFWVIPESLLTIETPAELIVEEEPMMEMESARSTETRSDLYRDVPFEVRAAEDTGDGLTLTGYAAVFNRSTMIDNWEGRFEERIRPGAFKRSINAKMPVLQFEHGRHPLLGSMPLGQITKLREDEHGLYVEARLADNWLIQPVRDAIASGSIDGMSFRFQVVRDSVDESGDTPVRTLEEVKLLELGPVVFPAYAETSVGVRSADLSPLFSLPQDDRQAIARALVLGTQPEPASNGTSERPADSDQDSQQHSGLSPHQRSAQLRTIEGVL